MTTEERLEICKSCEHYKLGICMKCGCILQVKARIPAAECPIGKWENNV